MGFIKTCAMYTVNLIDLNAPHLLNFKILYKTMDDVHMAH